MAIQVCTAPRTEPRVTAIDEDAAEGRRGFNAHAANRVGEPMAFVLARVDRKQLDGLTEAPQSNRAERGSTQLTIRDSNRHRTGDHESSGVSMRGQTRGHVDRRPEHVSAAFYDRTVVQPTASVAAIVEVMQSLNDGSRTNQPRLRPPRNYQNAVAQALDQPRFAGE